LTLWSVTYIDRIVSPTIHKGGKEEVDFSIAAILMQDGMTSGAIYALLALALVLVFSVTRVIFIPQGELVAYGALTMAALQANKMPPSAYLLLALGVLAFAQQVIHIVRSAQRRTSIKRDLSIAAAKFLLLPAVIAAICYAFAATALHPVLQILLTLAIVVPIGPLTYRLVYEPLREASVLVLLITSVALHFALTGLGLLMFGAEGARTDALSDARLELGTLSVSAQNIIVIIVAACLIVALYLYFERSLSGKALRATAANRLGARLVGIGTAQAGRLALTLAAALGALCGILIGPLTTMYYDSGFLIGLKGFVGAILGGLGSYPLAAAGALLVGLLEAFSSFWASAFKEVIVFTLIIPVLLWRSLRSPQHDDEDAQ
jgi:branched-chain amino acid transport system permease protein